ncbi:ABC transporter ATP-binding protein [Hymenobacter tibetensis]|uniref:ABC transporter ATP-binding protein n=1 Tax=Hymenobacter tibetensis TaxID=497967 RepID=A0ABY4CW18_9BACT|nr:ABC transporter ATP-binding protein [Hymenobacter tibetensis]UOG74464.1 ABC transporter ATP-binding protein [Hymenobacter tibetensis]
MYLVFTSRMSWLRVSNISLQEKESIALRGISFTQQQFQKLAIAGETGAGKSSLLQVIAGLIQPTGGEVHFEDGRVRGPAEKLMPGHPGIAYLSQHFELPKFLRVEQVLRYANKYLGEQASTLYEVCRISHLATRQTNQLSGGERQRIALARLLLSSPKLLLLDEPFSNLDRVHKNILKTVIEDIGTQLGITCLLISHDPADTLSWADEILVLKGGQLVQQGPPQQIYRQPTDEYTAALFGDYNLLSGPAVKAFAKLAGAKVQGTQFLVRPENFQLGQAARSQVATIQAVRFFGSYSELDARLLDAVVTIRTCETGFKVGQEVPVSLPKDGGWFI